MLVFACNYDCKLATAFAKAYFNGYYTFENHDFLDRARTILN